ncbi:hypothetical protein BDA96_10G016200 [Sorghum bicolor]|uniref:Uncharacterized protein n=1 Tax=Sorghum bicolor TaxID=4558 RepID=A0A921TZ55_SORBI|nr:hypothetical protein BDA96_10G016200 [Sorghum bicolor]
MPSPARRRRDVTRSDSHPQCGMATRNRTPLYRKYRDALRHVRAPAGEPSPSGGGRGVPVVEMASLLRSDRPYAPLSTDDPSDCRCHHHIRLQHPCLISSGLCPMGVFQLDRVAFDHANK